MARIPVIVSFGGVNAAGRSSGHHAYRRTVIDALDQTTAAATWRALAGLMNRPGDLDEAGCQYLREHTLIRRLEPQHFDPGNVAWNRRLAIEPANGGIAFHMARRNVPTALPEGWQVTEVDHRTVRVDIDRRFELFIEDHRPMEVSAAGQLPTGFDPQVLYPSRSHPRGLQMAVYGASDALGNLGLDWEAVAARVAPDQVSCYAGSAMGQLDADSNGGLIASRFLGRRVTSKHLALGFADMPAAFINAYVLGSLGGTGHTMGACATYLYNLRQGMLDIRHGRARVVLVGAAEAPLVPEIFDGYATMRALATDSELLELDRDKGLSEPDWRRACRPFSDNCGFTLAEGAQFTLLMDDELALELGAQIHGAVADVFVNADGYKKSISAPGVGNYLTFAKAAAMARTVVGEEALRRRSYVMAHGTGTPANRRTESRIFNETAKAFGIERWPVAAIKCYVGHTVGVAGGDQLHSALGVWAHGIIPAIATIDHIAEDVSASHLQFAMTHLPRGVGELDVVLINAKGFGGNNATATVVAPQVVERLLTAKHGVRAMNGWRERVAHTCDRSAAYDRAVTAGEAEVIYRFDYDVRADDQVRVTPAAVHIDGASQPVSLDLANPFEGED